MKRLRLSAKLAMAIIPIGLVALAAAGFIAFTFLEDSKQQNETANAATVTADAIDTLNAVWEEEDHARQVYIFGNENDIDDLASAMERTDKAIESLRDSTVDLQAVARDFFGEVADSVSEDVLVVVDGLNQMRSISNPTPTELDGYHDVADSILAVLPKTSSIVSDRVQSRELSTAYFLAEGGQVSLIQEQLIEEFRALEAAEGEAATVQERSALLATLDVLEGEFGAWALRANQTANQMNAAILRYTRLPEVDIDTFPLRRNEDILNTSEGLASDVAAESRSNAAESETEAYLVAGVAAVVLLLALLGSYAVIRSVVRRVRGVTSAAVQVSEEDLPALVDALQNPSLDVSDLQPAEITAAGRDEVGDLAKSFTSLHSTLISVAGQQMDILRKGVSDIFVTLARRNRSLVDRQLALLDELESREEDPETLGGYYKLDHLATRMRRNAESLLVLAGSEPTRIWSNPLDVSEIIRAALGEVDDYQRVDILALEPALVSGRAVADIAHLMSELLDNGTQYSSPSDRVRVAGLFDPDGYMLTVSDSGIGMTDARIEELNALLQNPPVLGLALQPTLGMYVVARLADRHGIRVQLISGSPGVTVRVLLPKSLIEPAAGGSSGGEIPAPTTTDYRPAVSGTSTESGLNGTGSESTSPQHVPPPAIEPAAIELPAEKPALPGKVKGKHEHPARAASIAPTEEPLKIDEAVSFTSNELTRRVPGEALRSGQAGDDQSVPDEKTTREWQPAPPVDPKPEPAKTSSPEPELAETSYPEPESVGMTQEDSAAAVPPEKPQGESPWWVQDDEPEEAVEAAEVSASAEDVFANWNEEDSKEEPEQPEDEPVALSSAGLPVRTPGVSFSESDESAVSSSASASGAIGIKSALAEFADGRKLASVEEPDSEDTEGSKE